MSESFDPYFKWLGIPPTQQPPNYYRLLGIQLYESDREVINYASDRQMSHVRSFQLGKYANDSQRILNEIAAARVCLLNEQAKARYDQQLQSRLAAEAAETSPVSAAVTADPPAAPPPLPPQQIAGSTPAADSGAQHALFLAYLDGALARVSGDIVSQDQEFEITEWGRKKYGLSSDQAYAALCDACASANKTLASLDRSRKLTPLRGQQPAWSGSPSRSTASTISPQPASTAVEPAAPVSAASRGAAPAPALLPKINTAAKRPEAKPGPQAASQRGVLIAVALAGVVLMGITLVSVTIVAAVFLLGDKSGQIVQRPAPVNPNRTAPPRPLPPTEFVPPDELQPPSPNRPSPSRPGPSRPGPQMIGPGPNWWDARTRALSHRAIVMAPETAEFVAAAQSDDPQTRAAAYRNLVQLAARSQNGHIAMMAEPILSGSYAYDPSDASAAALRQALVAAIPAAGAESPTDPRQCSSLFDMLGLLMACVQYNGAPSRRVDRLIVDAGSRLGTEFTADATRQRIQLRRAADAALCRRLYQNLAGRIDEGQAALGNSYNVIAQQADRRIGNDEREALDLSFTLSAVEKYPSQWRSYDFLVQQLCDSSRQETVLAMADCYERAGDAGLRQFMGERLIRRANLVGLSKPNEIAAAVRESIAGGAGRPPQGVSALGASQPSTASSAASVQAVDPRWDQLSRTAGSALADVHASANNSPKLLQEVVNLAHAATLACAMAQGDAGRAGFDRLRSSGPPVLSQHQEAVRQEPVRAAPQPPPASRVAYETAARHIAFLNNDSPSVETKVNYFRSLANLISSGALSDLRGEAAHSLAVFLLTPQAPELNSEVTKSLPDMAQLPFLLMALADEMEQTKAERQRVEFLLSTALERRIVLSAAGNWRAAARNELLSAAASRLSGQPQPAASGGSEYSAAIAALRQLYAQQAELLKAPPPENPATSTPAEVLRLLIKHLAARLSGAELAPQDRQFVDQLDHVFASIEYLSDNDLEKTVMLQQVWSRVLLLDLVVQRPEAGPRAAALRQQLDAADRNAKHVLLQLRDGHATLVETWLEFNRPK